MEEEISKFVGKLNKQEKKIVREGIKDGKSMGKILDQLTIERTKMNTLNSFKSSNQRGELRSTHACRNDVAPLIGPKEKEEKEEEKLKISYKEKNVKPIIGPLTSEKIIYNNFKKLQK